MLRFADLHEFFRLFAGTRFGSAHTPRPFRAPQEFLRVSQALDSAPSSGHQRFPKVIGRFVTFRRCKRWIIRRLFQSFSGLSFRRAKIPPRLGTFLLESCDRSSRGSCVLQARQLFLFLLDPAQEPAIGRIRTLKNIFFYVVIRLRSPSRGTAAGETDSRVEALCGADNAPRETPNAAAPRSPLPVPLKRITFSM